MLVVGITPSLGGAQDGKAETGRVIVSEKIADGPAIYEEGENNYLRLRLKSDGSRVLHRQYGNGRIRLDEVLPARRYRIISYARPCSGSCLNLDPPTDRCADVFRLSPRETLTITITTTDGSPCQIEIVAS